MDSQEAQLLTNDDVAKLLCVAPATLIDWRKDGRGPAYYKMGQQVRYKLSDILKWQKQSLVLKEPLEV